MSIAVLPGQTGMFEEPEYVAAPRPRALAASIIFAVRRLPRTKCSNCGLRRVCFVLVNNGVPVTEPLCAKDAGLR